MDRISKRSLIEKWYQSAPALLKKQKIEDLLKVYQDLERTLKGLKATAERHAFVESSLRYINIQKLIHQLSRSKRKLERKISNTLLIEKEQLKTRIQEMASSLSQKKSEN